MTASRISTIRKIGLTLGLALSISTVATSSSFAYSARAQQMCMGDAFRLCSSEIPNIARITACMRRNKAHVSRGCRAVIEEEEAKLTRTKPVHAAPVEQKPTVAPRVEQPTATKAKPVQAVPAEQKPAAASPVEQPAATGTKPVPAAPVEQKPAAASPVEQPVATETKPVQAAPVEQKPAAALPVEPPAATETKPAPAAPIEQKPTAASPVEPSAATETKSVQAAPVEQRPTTALPVEVKPIAAKSIPRGKPARMAQRKPRHRQLTVQQHIHREIRSIERTIGVGLLIPFVIMFYW
jgi:hypothetical protein